MKEDSSNTGVEFLMGNGDGFLDVAITGQGATVGDGHGVDGDLWSPTKK